MTNGFQPGQFIVIAGRPALGKSTLALNACCRAAIRAGEPTLFTSLEMSTTELVFKILSDQAKVPLQAMRAGRMNDDDWIRLARRWADIRDAPLYLDDASTQGVAEIAAKARHLQRTVGLKLLAVDYLQLMKAAGRRSENKQQEIEEISRSLKLLAKDLGVPVIAVAQLNRGPEQRQDKRPAMSDLRSSGAIEQDADMVLLVHRDDAYEQESPRAGEADLILAKNRNGPTGTVTVAFQGHYSRFVDMAA